MKTGITTKWVHLISAASLLAFGPLAFGQTKPIVASINANIGLYWPQLAANERQGSLPADSKFDMVLVGNAAQQLQQLVGGSLDIAYTNCDLAMKAKDKGGDVVIVGGAVNIYPYTIMSAPDVHQPKDLVGKKAILPFKTSLLTLFLNQWLQENGVDPSQVDEVFDGATPNRYAALKNGIVAAAVVSQPFDFRAKEEGFNKFFSYSKIGEFGFTCAVVNSGWAHENADKLRRHLKVMADITDWLYDPKNKDEAVAILTKVSKQPEPLVVETYDYYFNELKPFSKGMKVTKVGLEKLMGVLKDNGDIDKKWQMADFIDESYLP